MKTNAVLEAIKDRRSVRTFTNEQVSSEQLNAILEAAIYAPTGMNYQTTHFTAVLDAEKLLELNRRVKAVFARSTEERLQHRGENAAYNFYYHAPALVIVSNESTQPWAGQDCANALQSMFLAAQSLGVASCWINQLCSTCQDSAVRELLSEWGVPADHTVYGCAALGFNSGEAPHVPVHNENKISIVK